MVETDFSGEYLSAENTKDGDLLVFIAEGEIVDMERNGKTKKVLNIPVEVNQVKKIYTPFDADGRKLVEAFGKNTMAWVGKKARISHVRYKSFGQTKVGIEIEPLAVEVVE